MLRICLSESRALTSHRDCHNFMTTLCPSVLAGPILTISVSFYFAHTYLCTHIHISATHFCLHLARMHLTAVLSGKAATTEKP